MFFFNYFLSRWQKTFIVWLIQFLQCLSPLFRKKKKFYFVSKMWPLQIETVVLLFFGFFSTYLINPKPSSCLQQFCTMFPQQAWKGMRLGYRGDVLLKVSTCDWESWKHRRRVIGQSSITELNQLRCCPVTMAATDGRQWVIKRRETVSCRR